MEQSVNAALNDFKRQHGPEAFLCRYTKCPRAIMGYSSAELRQQHEATHVQRLRCMHSECGFSEWSFDTRSSLRKHIVKYHSKDKASRIPDSVSRRLHQQEEKPLFSFGSHSSKDDKRHGNDEEQKVVDVGNALGDLNFEDLPLDRKQNFRAFEATYNPAIPRNFTLSNSGFRLPIMAGVYGIRLGCDDTISIGFGYRLEIYDTSGQLLQTILSPDESPPSDFFEDHCCSPCGNYIAIAMGENLLKVSIYLTSAFHLAERAKIVGPTTQIICHPVMPT